MPALIANNATATLDVTLYDEDDTTVLASWPGQAAGTTWSAGTIYRNGFLHVQDGGGQAATDTVYLSDRTCVVIEGSPSAGYRVEAHRSADYEALFFVGFGLYVGLWVATMYMKFVRAGVNQNLG